MPNLSEARKKEKLSEFNKEHEADPKRNVDKLDAVIKRPVQGTAKATPKATSQDASDDRSGFRTL